MVTSIVLTGLKAKAQLRETNQKPTVLCHRESPPVTIFICLSVNLTGLIERKRKNITNYYRDDNIVEL